MPAHFIELISIFKEIAKKKQQINKDQYERLQNGIEIL